MLGYRFFPDFLFVACLVFWSGSLMADGSIHPSIDVAQFKDSQNKNYLEIYYSIPETKEIYEMSETGEFQCQLVLDLEIHLEDSLWTNKVWKIEKTLPDTSTLIKNGQMVDLIRYYVDKPGDYKVAIRIRDLLTPDKIDSVELAFTIEAFENEKIEISDIQLATELRKAGASDSESSLVKNNYKITPAPNSVFGSGSPSVFYYFEGYNLLKNLDSDRYMCVAKILDSNGREVEGAGLSYRTKIKKYDSTVEIGMLNVSSFPSGKYSLVYGIADSEKTMLASKQKLFYIFNPDVQVVKRVEETGFGPLDELSEDELDEEFKMMRYIYDKPEKEFYASLSNAEAKKKYLYGLWRRPNENELPAFAYRDQYLGRAQYANNQFKSVFAKGWKSDRGRTFVLYGVPSLVERFPQTESTVPLQIWRYDKLKGQGGVEFIFADFAGFGKYEIVHSDLRGERYNLDWRREVSRGSNEKQFGGGR